MERSQILCPDLIYWGQIGDGSCVRVKLDAFFYLFSAREILPYQQVMANAITSTDSCCMTDLNFAPRGV